MSDIKTNPEMNEQIVGFLKFDGGPHSLYAAARIEELEAIVSRLPVTIDGVRVVPTKDDVWRWVEDGGDTLVLQKETPHYLTAEWSYSTEAAALAAGKGESDEDDQSGNPNDMIG